MRFLPPIHGLGHKLRKTVTPHFIFVKDILLLFIVLEAHSPSFSEVKVDFFSSPSGKTWVWFFSGSFRCRFGFPGSTFEGSNGSLFFLHTDVAAMDLLLFNAVASALLLTNFYHNGPNDLTFFLSLLIPLKIFLTLDATENEVFAISDVGILLFV